MSVLKIKNAQGEWQEVPFIKGDKGDKGDTYVLTEEDKEDIAGLVDIPIQIKYVKDDESDNGGVIEGRVTGDYANVASGSFSHAEGTGNTASGISSHAEGAETTASGGYAHAEGASTEASGGSSHAEGSGTIASGQGSHAEGTGTKATNYYAHAEGGDTIASGICSHAEGNTTWASGYMSHAEGSHTIAQRAIQHVSGKYNIVDSGGDGADVSGNYAVIVGNGTSDNKRSNAYTLDWQGNGVYSGKLTVGTAPINDMDVATKKYVDDVKGASIHICSSEEYDSTTRIPIIQNPDERTFYLVPSEDGTSPDLFVEWAYVNNAWEMFGSASIDLSGYLTDVQINGTSVVTNGVANVPVANNDTFGVVKAGGNYGVVSNNGRLMLNSPTSTLCKQGTNGFIALMPSVQHYSAFYGLAKAAGDTTQSASSNAVGNYTPEAKGAIQSMLGIDSLIAPTETNPFTDAHAIGDLFIINGALYKAKTAIAVGDVLDDGVNVESVDSSDVYVKNTDIAGDNYGVIKVKAGDHGLTKASNGYLQIYSATSNDIKGGSQSYRPIAPNRQNESVFYGLAKASGDSTQSASDNAVGSYTDEAKASIQNMLGVPSVDDIPDVPVEDVQIDGASILSDGVAEIPIADATNLGVSCVNSIYGIGSFPNGHCLYIYAPTSSYIKSGTNSYRPIVPKIQHESAFYGLAKAAGHDEKDSTLTVGNYTPEAKGAIQSMLGIDSLIAPTETNPFTDAHTIGDLFIINGTLYRAKTAIAVGDVLDDGVNVESIDSSDVYVKNTDYADSANQKEGIIGKSPVWSGVRINNGQLFLTTPNEALIKQGTDNTRTSLINQQHIATFYGLAKASGDTTQSASSNAVGTYTDEAKTSIKQMLGVVDSYDSLVVNVTGTDPVITAQPSYRYNCGEVTTLTITPPSSGTIDFIFTSGTTPTVLDLPSTVKMPSWWIGVEANTTYEMCITDATYCGVMSWDV